ncbi:MAG: murein L,D-transpeptidase catalytic domain family protein [Acidobacteriota bacterium]
MPAAARDSLAVAGPRAELLALAERAADRYLADHSVAQPQLLTVIDYSLPSTEPRLWVIDRAHGRVLFRDLVAHGRGSGENYATRFSNQDGSLESSLGLFLTADTYIGRNGYSLHLEGLEPGVNDRARERTLVMHGAWYVSAEFAREHGRLGRSWGCPALSPDVAPAVIDRIRNGSLLFVYARDPSWLATSRYLVAATPAAAAGASHIAAPR